METQHTLDSMQEALRIIYLEDAKEPSVNAGKQMAFLAASVTQMKADKKESLLKKLSEVMSSLTFGQLLERSMQQLGQSEADIAESIDLPADVIWELKADTVYTNNVPIVLLKKLLTHLKVPFGSAERAILKTFDSLQSHVADQAASFSGFSPAFRKGHDATRHSITDNRMKADGKELFENKEALDKYLARLNNLMNQ